MSEVLEYLNENKLRGYPIRETSSRTSGAFVLSDSVVLDAVIVNDSQNEIVAITASATEVVFDLTDLSFIVDKSKSFPQYVRIANGSLIVVGSDCLDIDDGVYSFTDLDFESSVCYEFTNEWLGVSSIDFGSDTLTGEIDLVEGYQFDIGISNQTLNLGVGSNYGIPIVCDEFVLPAVCENNISYINGAAPNRELMKFIGGSQIRVVDDPINNRIFVGLSFNLDDICEPPVVSNI